jgi:hypothetical protein
MLRELPLRVLIVHRCGAALGERRADGVDCHAVRRERTGQGMHEPDEGSFSGRVVVAYDASGKGDYRGDEGYSLLLALSHSGCDPPVSKKADLRVVVISWL